jgi:hypothetical protein
MKPRMKKKRPQLIAILEMNLMNFSISMAMGVSLASADCARLAI